MLYRVSRLRRLSALWCVCLLMLSQWEVARASVVTGAVDYVANRVEGTLLLRRLLQGRSVTINDANIIQFAKDPAYVTTADAVSGIITNATGSTGGGVINGIVQNAWTVAGLSPWWRYAAVLDAATTAGYNATSYLLGGLNDSASIGVAADTSGNPAFVAKVTPPAITYPATSDENGLVSSHASAADINAGNYYALGVLLNAGVPLYRDPSACYMSNVCYYFPSMPDAKPFSKSLGSLTSKGDTFWFVAANWADVQTYYGKLVSAYNVYAFPGCPGSSCDAKTATNFRLVPNGTGSAFKVLYDYTVTTYCGATALASCKTVVTQYYNTDAGITVDPKYAGAAFATLDQLRAGLSDDMLNSKVNPAVVARIIDSAWQLAAQQPGYTGMPYSASNPVTAADVQSLYNDHPDYAVTVADMLDPAKDSTSPKVPINITLYNIPTYYVNNTYAPQTTNQIKLDLGDDPGTPDPSLEDVPTGDAIAGPLNNMGSQLRAFTVPSHNCACPKYTITAFGKDIVMDSHCTIAESQRQAITLIMTAVWAIIGLFWVLRA